MGVPLVVAEAHQRTGEIIAAPYKSSRVTPADHTVEDDTYDWKHQAPIAPLPELHFDRRESRSLEWVWWGLACQILLIPLMIVLNLLVNVLHFYSWGAWEIVVPAATMFCIGMASSLRALISVPRAQQPFLTLFLGLVTIALGLVIAFVYTPRLLSSDFRIDNSIVWYVGK